MSIKPQSINTKSVLATLVVGIAGVGLGQAPSFELQELKTTLEASARKIGELQTQLNAQKAQSQALSQALAAANAESASGKEGLEKLRGVLEGLGIGALENSSNQLQERLLAALSDMRLLDDQKKSLTESLVTLSEAAVAYAKTTPTADEGAAKALEAAAIKAEKALHTAAASGTTDATAADLHNTRVVSVKPELRVAVLNVGARDGVKVGMPFSVIREDKTVAKLMVVDVRKSVAGAVIQESTNTNESVKIGDRSVIDTDRSF